MTIIIKGIHVYVNDKGFKIISSGLFFKTLEDLKAAL